MLTNKHFDHDRPTAMFVFGWIQSPVGDTSRQLIDAYIERADYNFLVLDWSDYNVDPYTVVMLRMCKMSRIVGRAFAKLFRKGLNDETFHCVGKEFRVAGRSHLCLRNLIDRRVWLIDLAQAVIIKFEIE